MGFLGSMGFMINEFPWELRYPTIHQRGTACCGAAEKEVSLQALQALEAEAIWLVVVATQIFLVLENDSWKKMHPFLS